MGKAYLCDELFMSVMKKSFIVLFSALILGCTLQKQADNAADDSRYQWESIRQYILQEPEQALAMVDTANMKGLADVNYANWMRAVIYYSSQKVTDYDKARELCLAILDNKDPEADSLRKMRTLSLLTGICGIHPDTYQDAVRYAVQGAQMAHLAGNIQQEAEFYFEAGKVMERLQRGSGIDYMNRSLDILREASRDSLQPLTILSPSLGNAARVLAGQENYAAVIPLLQERLQVIDRIEKEYTTAPAGWIDSQRANTYSVLAYCQHKTGDKAGARRTAEAFEKTQTARNPNSQADIMNYYALAGNDIRLQQIYNFLEPLYREREDTLSRYYADLLSIYATGLGNSGRYREAFQISERFQVIKDSLTQRERRSETLMWAQQMKTQEKELQLKDEEAKTRIQRIFLLAAIIVILLIGYLLVRAHIYNKTLEAKNRSLYLEIQQREKAEAQEREALQERPAETLSQNQLLYRRLCELMKDPEVFTNPDTNQDTLASLAGTNRTYVYDALRECAGVTPTDFINGYRLRYAANLLATTTDSVALIAELCGLSRRTFYRLFDEAYAMSPSDYRKVAKK